MDIRLNWIHIKHFKGIKEFILKADGKQVFVYGANGAGKTTLEDSFFWTLFNKDSSGRDGKNFKVKPQDKDGKDINHLQTQVEMELLIDGQPLKIKKMQEEKWTKKRGAEATELTGNTISYWWNEVPVKESEFKQKVSELLDEKIFKMITDPFYYNLTVKWQDRRNMLLMICGDATDEQVIDSDSKLSKLKNVLNGRSIEDYKKILADKIKGLKKEKENIPPRIDELTLSLPQEEIDYSQVEEELSVLNKLITDIESKMTNQSNIMNDFRKKSAELTKLKGELIKVKEQIDTESNSVKRHLIEQKSELETGKYLLENSIKQLENEMQQYKSTLQTNSDMRERLLNEWRTLKIEKENILAEEFIDPTEDSFICPTCSQQLPTGNVEEKLAEMRTQFDNNKISKLANITSKLDINKSQGLTVKSVIEQSTKSLDETKAELEQKREKLIVLIRDIAKLETAIKEPTKAPDYSTNQQYVSLEKQINDFEAILETPAEDITSSLIIEKQQLQAKIDELKKTLNNKDTVDKNLKRIEELKEEEKRISALITEFEGHQFLLERFTVAKVNLLEDKINSRFKNVRFKMFEENISNDGIQECCIAMVNTNGCYVPFEDANHAGKVNAGVDCINALGEYYGITAPVWIDFRESVSEIIETPSQLINLVKPPSWDELDWDTQLKLAGVEKPEPGELLTLGEMAVLEKAKEEWNKRNKSLRVEVVG